MEKILNKQGEIVKFHNHLNEVKLSRFNLYDYKIFFSSCAKALEKGEELIEISFNELKEVLNLINSKTVTNEYLKQLIKSTAEKINQIKFRIDNEIGEGEEVLFTGFFISKGSQPRLTLRVNPVTKYILNNLVKNFTLANLQILNSFKSKYSYRLYLELKQFGNMPNTKKIEKNGKLYCWRNFTIENFREILDIPTSYLFKDINKRILTPSIEEIQEHFEEINIEKIYKGRKVINIIFYFNFKQEHFEIVENKEISELEEYFNLTFITTKFTKDIKNKLEELEKKHSIKYLKNWLMETWQFVYNNQNIKNKDAYFANLIVAGASPISSKKKEELDRLDKIEKKAQEYVNIIVPFGKEEEEEQRVLYKNVFSSSEKNEEDIKEPKIKKIGDSIALNSNGKIELEKEKFEKLRKEYIDANIEKCMKERNVDRQLAVGILKVLFNGKYTVKKEE